MVLQSSNTEACHKCYLEGDTTPPKFELVLIYVDKVNSQGHEETQDKANEAPE